VIDSITVRSPRAGSRDGARARPDGLEEADDVIATARLARSDPGPVTAAVASRSLGATSARGARFRIVGRPRAPCVTAEIDVETPAGRSRAILISFTRS
jgi:hypothetical protein